jgi:hypothetical protein
MDWFNEAMTEFHEDYVYDLIYDLEEEELQGLLNGYNIDTVEGLINEFNSQYENGYQWYKETFGTEDIQYVIDKYDLLDMDAIIEYCKEVEGKEYILEFYGGVENEIEIDDITYYIYRLN